MKEMTVVVVRVYITEGSHLLPVLVKYLQQEAKVRGVSVFRAISGFGSGGEHGSSLVDLSLDLPLVVEFFDSENKITHAVEHLNTIIKPGHVIFWNATMNCAEENCNLDAV